MTEDDLAKIEAEHRQADPDDHPSWVGHCLADAETMPCVTLRLVAEVRRLREYIEILGMNPDNELARMRPVVTFKESP